MATDDELAHSRNLVHYRNTVTDQEVTLCL